MIPFTLIAPNKYPKASTAKEMKNNQFSEFCFEKKVANTCDKKYTIRLMEEKTSDENGVGFYHDKKDGTLVAKTITKRFDLETFIMVISFVLFIWGFFKVLYKYRLVHLIRPGFKLGILSVLVV